MNIANKDYNKYEMTRENLYKKHEILKPEEWYQLAFNLGALSVNSEQEALIECEEIYEVLPPAIDRINHSTLFNKLNNYFDNKDV